MKCPALTGGMTFSFVWIRRLVLLYLALPTLVFLIGWYRMEIGIPGALAVTWACLKFWRNPADDMNLVTQCQAPCALRIGWPVLLITIVGLSLWCLGAGQGAFVAQMSDWHWRNAVFRDLMTHPWPVLYPTWGGALVFYMGHWLPPAAIGRIAYCLCGDADFVWRIGNILLFMWTFLGVFLVLLLSFFVLNANSARRQLLVLAVLIAFGGTSQMGFALLNMYHALVGGEVLPWLVNPVQWSELFQFAPNSVLLSWVFHQTISPWLAVLFIIAGCPLRMLAFIVSLTLICAPLPAFGLAVVALVAFVAFLCCLRRNGQPLCEALRHCVSGENLVGVLIVLPLVALYLGSNPQSGSLSFAWDGVPKGYFLRRYVLFILGECGLYWALTMHMGWKNMLWWGMVISLLVSPLFKVSKWTDFCMRASVPALTVLSIFVLHAVFISWNTRRRLAYMLLLSLMIGSGGALYQARRTLRETRQIIAKKDVALAADLLGTLDQDHGAGHGWWVVMHCCTKTPGDSVFFRHLARRCPKGCRFTGWLDKKDNGE